MGTRKRSLDTPARVPWTNFCLTTARPAALAGWAIISSNMRGHCSRILPRLPFIAFLLAAATANPQGVITTVAGTDWTFPTSSLRAVNAPLGTLFGVAFDAAGNAYVADDGNDVVMRIAVDGTLTVVAGNGIRGFSGDGGPATSASLNAPFGAAVDTAGNLYFSDGLNQRVRKVSGGIITTLAGNGTFGFSGDGGPAASAELAYPSQVAVDSAGNVYIADSNNSRFRKVSNGIITTVAGNGMFAFSGDGGPAINAALNNPYGISVDAADNLLITDSYNHRVRKVSGGIITTVAGNGNATFSGDGGPATSAGLNRPY